MTDLDALKQYADSRDPDAFKFLVYRYQQMVYSVCRRRSSNAADAEDAAQETFLRLARNAGSVRSNLAAWLHTSATRASLDLARGSTRRQKREQMHSPPPADVDSGLEWEELRQGLDDAIAKLDEEDRNLLVRHYFVGCSQAELAREARMTQSGIKRRLDRVVDRLRATLKSRGFTGTSAMLTMYLSEETARAAVPAGLTANLTKIGVAGVGGGSTSAGVLTMTASVKVAALAGGIIILGGMGYWLSRDRGPSAAPPTPAPVPIARTVRPAPPPVDVAPEEKPAPIQPEAVEPPPEPPTPDPEPLTATDRPAAPVEEPIEAQVRAVVAAYLNAGLNGQDATPYCLGSTVAKQASDLREIARLSDSPIEIDTVYHGQLFALAVSSGIRVDPEHEGEGILVFFLARDQGIAALRGNALEGRDYTEGTWLIHDVDFESEEGAANEVQRYKDTWFAREDSLLNDR